MSFPSRRPSPGPAAFLRRPVVLLLLAAFFWGSGNVANKTILDTVDPWTAVLLRCLIAALVLLPFALRESRRHPQTGWRSSSLLPSALFAIALVLQQMGFATTTVTAASFLVNAGCVLTPLLAALLLRESPSRATWTAALLMFAGATAISGAATSPATMNPGDILSLLSALAYAGWALALGRHAMRHGRPVSTTLVHCGLTAAIVLPVAASGWTTSAAAVAATLRDALPEAFYLGVFSTAAAFLLTTIAQARVSASTASILIAAESLFGAAGGILFLGERPGDGVLAGAALMLAAIAVAARAAARETSAPPAMGPQHA